MHRRLIFLLGAALAAAVPVFAATAALPETAAVARGVDYIKTTQQDNGGFGGFGDGQTYDAIFALRSAGVDVETVVKNGKTPIDFLEVHASAADNPATAAKAALAARAAGLDPTNVAGTNLVALVRAGYDPATGQYGADDFSQSLAMIGIACTGNPVPNSAILALRATQLANGGWGFGGNADPDTTALAIQALLAADIPVSDADVRAAFAYLDDSQGTDGGWGFDPTASNANSTAFVLQAYLAAGIDPDSIAGAIPFLLSQQGADGSFAGFDPAFSTNQVLPLLMGRTYCDMPDAPIQPLPSPTATVTAPPSASPSPTVVAPRPPNTGSGLASGDDASTMLALIGSVVLLAGGATLVATRRRG